MKKIFFTKFLLFILFFCSSLFFNLRIAQAGTDTCAASHPAVDGNPAWSCQSKFACGITLPATQCKTPDNIAQNSCQSNLCNAPGQGADIICCKTKWCLTPDNNCLIGNGTPCPGKMYDTEQSCKDVAKTKWCFTSQKKCELKNDGSSCNSGQTFDKQEDCVEFINSHDESSGSSATAVSTSSTFNAQAIVSLENPIGTTDITQIFGNLIKVSLGILGSLALLVFIYGGFVWLTSAGSSEKVQKGTTAMVWAVMGIVVIFASYAIISVILQGLGVSTASAVVTTNKKLDIIPETKKSQVCHCNVVASASIPVFGSCNTTISQDFIIGKSYGPVEYKQLIDQASMTGSGCTTAKALLNGQIKDMQPIVFTENTCQMFSDTSDSKFGATYNLKCQLQ
ncbi:MAG: pilin [Patescibacteria group bacterium]|nr:pilin [Patescibacteria group bacterium]